MSETQMTESPSSQAESTRNLPPQQTAPAKPAWMVARQRELESRKEQNADPAPEAIAAANETKPRPKLKLERVSPIELTPEWKQWVDDLMKGGLWGLFVSLLVHAALLVIFGLIVFKASREDETVIDSALNEDSGIEIFEQLPPVTTEIMEEPAAQFSAAALMQLENNNETSFDSAEFIDNVIRPESEGDGDGNGGEGIAWGNITPPDEARVVTKGSFSAWTVPADPTPGEPYYIHILVKLPEKIERYRTSDLSGLVIGTDKYTQKLPGKTILRMHKYLPIKDHKALLVVAVPGAEELVRDVIKVRSKTLNEEQELEIEF